MLVIIKVLRVVGKLVHGSVKQFEEGEVAKALSFEALVRFFVQFFGADALDLLDESAFPWDFEQELSNAIGDAGTFEGQIILRFFHQQSRHIQHTLFLVAGDFYDLSTRLRTTFKIDITSANIPDLDRSVLIPNQIHVEVLDSHTVEKGHLPRLRQRYLPMLQLDPFTEGMLVKVSTQNRPLRNIHLRNLIRTHQTQMLCSI